MEFHLAPTASGGTLLTLRESGFRDLPDARRTAAFAMHQQGWTQQMKNIQAYLDQHR